MIDDQLLLEHLAATDVIAPDTPLPKEAWTRDVALAEIERRVGMQTRDRTEQPLPQPQRSRGWLVAAVAFVAVLVIGSALLLVFSGGGGPEVVDEPTTTIPVTTVAPDVTSTTEPPTTTSAATSTTEATATTTIPAVPDALGIVWQQVEAPAFEGGWIAGVTEGGPGLIAVGGTRSGDIHPNSGRAFYQAGVWISSDGATWEPIDSPDFSVEDEYGTGSVYMTDVAVGPTGVVGVGWAGGRAAFWISPDGLDWRRIQHDDAVFGTFGEVHHLVAAPFGLVAIGVATTGDGDEVVAAWVSAEGSEWTRSTLATDGSTFATDYLGFAGTRMDLTAWGDQVVAVGALERDGPDTYRPAIWITGDGITWDLVSGSGGGTIEWDDVGDGATLSAVAPYGDGLVAFGLTDDVARYPDPAVWSSQNGRDWQLGASDFFYDVFWGVASLAAADDRLVLGIGDAGGARLLGSADGGATWHVLEEFSGGLGGEFAEMSGDRIFWTVNDVVSVGDAVIAAGRTLAFTSGEDFEGRCIWDEGAGRCRTDAAIWIGNWDE